MKNKVLMDGGYGSDLQVKLVTVTRKDLKNGQQLAQSIHSSNRFAYHYPELHREWIEKSEYVISLSVKNEEQLKDLYDKLKWYGAHVVAFYEPDINNQMTSICYYGTPEMRKHTQKLDLALSEVEVATNN